MYDERFFSYIQTKCLFGNSLRGLFMHRYFYMDRTLFKCITYYWKLAIFFTIIQTRRTFFFKKKKISSKKGN